MEYEPTNIISRIQWCWRQQQLQSITLDERAGWRAEEAGLVDALGCRDRVAFMIKEHRSHFIRYQCGLEDGRALLRLSAPMPRVVMRMEGSQAPLATPAWAGRHPSQVSSRVHVKESRR
jgi:hypothetical protein